MATPLEHGAAALECELCSKHIALVYDSLRQNDELIAKALVVGEMAQIARLEMRMAELLQTKWRAHSKLAVSKFDGTYKSSGNVESALDAIDGPMRSWDEDVAPRYGAALAKIYRLARIAAWKRAKGLSKVPLHYYAPQRKRDAKTAKVEKAEGSTRLTPRFDLYDESAIQALMDDQMFWIGRHYEENVRRVLRKTVAETVVAGLGRDEAGRKLREVLTRELAHVSVPRGFRGTQDSYFEMLSANAATTSRVRGQIRSFVDIGVTRYEIMNPQDSRTSTICWLLVGKVFEVEHAVQQIEREAGATSPDQIKQLHPFLSPNVVQGLTSRGHVSDKDSSDLAKIGLALPPYHERCRSTIDISDQSSTFESLREQSATREVSPIVRPVSTPIAIPTPNVVIAELPPAPTRRAPSAGFRARATTTPREVTPSLRPATIPPRAKR